LSAPLSITGLGCLSRLGDGIVDHRHALARPPAPFRRLGEAEGAPVGFEALPAGWIEPRGMLGHRKWSPSSMAALHVARQAVMQAGWTERERADAVVFLGTSRGSMAGWTEPWPRRRAFGRMAASNSLTAEPAAALGAELGIGGPWQVLSSGCCAGLDALGMASLWLRSGLAQHALAVAVDLPLVAPVLDSYRRTGLLATAEQPGMVPAEGAAALCLETRHDAASPALLDYRSTAEPGDLLGAAASPALGNLLRELALVHPPDAIVPHASGTPALAEREPASVRAALGPDLPQHPLKPWTGHTIGASGLLETVLAVDCLRERRPLPGSARPPSLLCKIASALGGKHSIVVLRSPS